MNDLLFSQSTFDAVSANNLGLDIQREVVEAVMALLAGQKLGAPCVMIVEDIHDGILS